MPHAQLLEISRCTNPANPTRWFSTNCNGTALACLVETQHDIVGSDSIENGVRIGKQNIILVAVLLLLRQRCIVQKLQHVFKLEQMPVVLPGFPLANVAHVDGNSGCVSLVVLKALDCEPPVDQLGILQSSSKLTTHKVAVLAADWIGTAEFMGASTHASAVSGAALSKQHG